MAQGVYTRQKRFTFVEKTAAEVGDSTAYPMLATADQIAEVMYRVRLSKFTQGSFSDSFGTYFEAVNIGDDPTTAEPFEIDTVNGYYAVRGYGVAWDDSIGEDVAAPFLPYYGDKITMTYSGVDYNYRQALNEYSVFVPPYDRWVSSTGIINPSPTDYFQTGFSYVADGNSLAPPSLYNAFLASFNGSSFVQFSGEVAWVDINGSGNPLDPLNEMYIGVELFSLYVSFFGIHTNNTYGGTMTGADFVLELSGGQELRCSIYSGSTFTSVQDVRLKAIEWFPYQDAGGNVWNPATGLPA